MPSDHWGETVKAVVSRGDGALTEEEVISHCRQRLAHYKCPTSVDWMEEIVVTATKRTDSLQDVSMSVGVLTGEQIDNLGISGPLTDKVGARLAFSYDDIDGNMDNVATGDDNGGAAEKLALLGTLIFDATDNLSIVAKFEGGNRDFEGYASQARGATTTESFDQSSLPPIGEDKAHSTHLFNTLPVCRIGHQPGTAGR